MHCTKYEMYAISRNTMFSHANVRKLDAVLMWRRRFKDAISETLARHISEYAASGFVSVCAYVCVGGESACVCVCGGGGGGGGHDIVFQCGVSVSISLTGCVLNTYISYVFNTHIIHTWVLCCAVLCCAVLCCAVLASMARYKAEAIKYEIFQIQI